MKKIALIAGVGLTLIPLTLFAQSSSDSGFARNGVFGCNQTGAYAMSVGALSAVGGVYVPVNDAAVTLNTGYLVYKECVLRGIVDRIRENATASLNQSITRAYVQGRALPLGGNGAYFSQSIPLEAGAVKLKTLIDSQTNGYFDSLNPAFKGPVLRAIYTGYAKSANNPTGNLSCDFPGDLSSALNGSPSGNYWDSVGALMNPTCNPYYAYYAANNSILAAADENWNNIQMQLGWYNGNYPVTQKDAQGNDIVVTPGSIVGSNYQQAEQTGFTQLQNANDIDQIIGALFSGLTTQVIADQGGLVGLTKGKPSYLDRVVADSLTGLRTAIANLGLATLVPVQQDETTILHAYQAIAQSAQDAIASLRKSEQACWNIVINGDPSAAVASGTLPHVCYTPVTWTPSGPQCKAPPVCTSDDQGNTSCVDGPTLHIATSTAFSQAAIIDAGIASLASSTAASINSSQALLTQVNNLISNISKVNVADAERQAVQDLDGLVAQGYVLPTQYDAGTAQQTSKDVATQMQNFTCTGGTTCDSSTSWPMKWADSTDKQVGWCNAKNPAVIQSWTTCWTPGATTTCAWKL